MYSALLTSEPVVSPSYHNARGKESPSAALGFSLSLQGLLPYDFKYVKIMTRQTYVTLLPSSNKTLARHMIPFPAGNAFLEQEFEFPMRTDAPSHPPMCRIYRALLISVRPRRGTTTTSPGEKKNLQTAGVWTPSALGA